jgi:phage FluMu protein Com
VNCPKCKEENDDNWPLEIDSKIMWGGCQLCWEAECSEKWWKRMETIADGWISVEEPPKEDGYYWCYCIANDTSTMEHPTWQFQTLRFQNKKFITAFLVTHWQPLPNPPQEK